MRSSPLKVSCIPRCVLTSALTRREPENGSSWGKCGNACPHVCSRTSTWPGLAARSGPTPCSLPNIVPCTWPVPGFCSLRHLTTFSERTSPTLPQPHPIPSLGQTCNYRTWKAASEIPHRGRAAPSKQPCCEIFFLQHLFTVAVLCHLLLTSHQWPCQLGLPLTLWAQSKSKMEPPSLWPSSLSFYFLALSSFEGPHRVYAPYPVFPSPSSSPSSNSSLLSPLGPYLYTQVTLKETEPGKRSLQVLSAGADLFGQGILRSVNA